MLPIHFTSLIYVMTTNIIGGFLFGAILVIVMIGTAVNEARDRKKNNRQRNE